MQQCYVYAWRSRGYRDRSTVPPSPARCSDGHEALPPSGNLLPDLSISLPTGELVVYRRRRGAEVSEILHFSTSARGCRPHRDRIPTSTPATSRGASDSIDIYQQSKKPTILESTTLMTRQCGGPHHLFHTIVNRY